MARPREPISLIEAKGKKHLTKAEIAGRRASEVQPRTEGIEPPPYLTAAQKKHFVKLADQMVKIKVMGETDCDTLARYVTAESMYQAAVKDLREVQKQRPKDADAKLLMAWAAMVEKLDKRQERFFKQASTMARDLGLTISSRCKLVVPKATTKSRRSTSSRSSAGRWRAVNDGPCDRIRPRGRGWSRGMR